MRMHSLEVGRVVCVFLPNVGDPFRGVIRELLPSLETYKVRVWTALRTRADVEMRRDDDIFPWCIPQGD